MLNAVSVRHVLSCILSYALFVGHVQVFACMYTLAREKLIHAWWYDFIKVAMEGGCFIGLSVCSKFSMMFVRTEVQDLCLHRAHWVHCWLQSNHL